MKMVLYELWSLFQRTTQFKQLGQGSVVKPPYAAWNRDLILIGRNTFISSHSFFALTPDNKDSPVVRIGDNCCIGKNFFLAAVRSITIEDYVLLSDRVFISDHIHDYSDIHKPIIQQPLVFKGAVVIKSGAFVGINSVIMPGVTIGRNAVVGASSVVLRDVPDFCVVSGNPAKIIKKYDQRENRWERFDS